MGAGAGSLLVLTRVFWTDVCPSPNTEDLYGMSVVKSTPKLEDIPWKLSIAVTSPVTVLNGKLVCGRIGSAVLIRVICPDGA